MKAQILTEDNAQPKLHKVQSLPYSIHLKVETDLKDQGILSKVDCCDWAIYLW